MTRLLGQPGNAPLRFRARILLREALAQEIDPAERDLDEFGGAHGGGTVAAVLARLGAPTGTVPGDR